jgi:hypothetical protein
MRLFELLACCACQLWATALLLLCHAALTRLSPRDGCVLATDRLTVLVCGSIRVLYTCRVEAGLLSYGEEQKGRAWT